MSVAMSSKSTTGYATISTAAAQPAARTTMTTRRLVDIVVTQISICLEKIAKGFAAPLFVPRDVAHIESILSSPSNDSTTDSSACTIDQFWLFVANELKESHPELMKDHFLTTQFIESNSHEWKRATENVDSEDDDIDMKFDTSKLRLQSSLLSQATAKYAATTRERSSRSISDAFASPISPSPAPVGRFVSMESNHHDSPATTNTIVDLCCSSDDDDDGDYDTRVLLEKLVPTFTAPAATTTTKKIKKKLFNTAPATVIAGTITTTGTDKTNAWSLTETEEKVRWKHKENWLKYCEETYLPLFHQCHLASKVHKDPKEVQSCLNQISQELTKMSVPFLVQYDILGLLKVCKPFAFVLYRQIMKAAKEYIATNQQQQQQHYHRSSNGHWQQQQQQQQRSLPTPVGKVFQPSTNNVKRKYHTIATSSRSNAAHGVRMMKTHARTNTTTTAAFQPWKHQHQSINQNEGVPSNKNPLSSSSRSMMEIVDLVDDDDDDNNEIIVMDDDDDNNEIIVMDDDDSSNDGEEVENQTDKSDKHKNAEDNFINKNVRIDLCNNDHEDDIEDDSDSNSAVEVFGNAGEDDLKKSNYYHNHNNNSKSVLENEGSDSDSEGSCNMEQQEDVHDYHDDNYNKHKHKDNLNSTVPKEDELSPSLMTDSSSSRVNSNSAVQGCDETNNEISEQYDSNISSRDLSLSSSSSPPLPLTPPISPCVKTSGTTIKISYPKVEETVSVQDASPKGESLTPIHDNGVVDNDNKSLVVLPIESADAMLPEAVVATAAVSAAGMAPVNETKNMKLELEEEQASSLPSPACCDHSSPIVFKEESAVGMMKAEEQSSTTSSVATKRVKKTISLGCKKGKGVRIKPAIVPATKKKKNGTGVCMKQKNDKQSLLLSSLHAGRKHDDDDDDDDEDDDNGNICSLSHMSSGITRRDKEVSRILQFMKQCSLLRQQQEQQQEQQPPQYEDTLATMVPSWYAQQWNHVGFILGGRRRCDDPQQQHRNKQMTIQAVHIVHPLDAHPSIQRDWAMMMYDSQSWNQNHQNHKSHNSDDDDDDVDDGDSHLNNVDENDNDGRRRRDDDDDDDTAAIEQEKKDNSASFPFWHICDSILNHPLCTTTSVNDNWNSTSGSTGSTSRHRRLGNNQNHDDDDDDDDSGNDNSRSKCAVEIRSSVTYEAHVMPFMEGVKRGYHESTLLCLDSNNNNNNHKTATTTDDGTDAADLELSFRQAWMVAQSTTPNDQSQQSQPQQSQQCKEEYQSSRGIQHV